jgi:Phage integrase family
LERRSTSGNVRREFYDLLKAQNLPRMRPHDLRHSYATILLATGEHPKVVQEILGHSSVQLTLDTYSHLLPDLMLKERAAAKLDAILSGGNDNPGQNPGQTDPARVVDQEKWSNSFEDVVSRVGIEPTTRRLRVCCSAN